MQKYLDICQEAVKNEEIFKTFKQHPHYTKLLEHCSYEMGTDYLEEIKKHSPYLLEHISKFITNDTVGNPTVYWYKDINENVSPTTLRYIKVLGDLINLFGSLDGMRIIEIGGGYGGQCKIIHDIAKPHSYTIIDLPEVLDLISKYLGEFNIQNVQLKKPGNLTENKYSLCISNYAFTEVRRKYQNLYIKNVISKSNRGYITCNFFGRTIPPMLSYDEIATLKPNSKFLPEIPLTAHKNIVYVWNLPVK